MYDYSRVNIEYWLLFNLLTETKFNKFFKTYI